MFGNKLEKIEKLTPKDDEAKLSALLRDKSEDVVYAAIDGLGKRRGDVAFNALVPLLNSSVAAVRAHAARALGEMRLPKARAFLLHLREQETDKDVRAAIDEVLQLINVKL